MSFELSVMSYQFSVYSELITQTHNSIQFLQLNALVVFPQNLIICRAVQRHAISANLAHTDAMTPAATVERHAKHFALRVPFDIEGEETVSQTQQRTKTQSTNGGASVRSYNLSAQRPEGHIEFLTRLMHLPQRDSGVTVCRRIGKIDPINQHLNRVEDGTKIQQLTANPCPLSHREPLITYSLVNRCIRTQSKFPRLTVNGNLHYLSIPRRQDTLLPFERVFFVNEPEK